MRYVPMILSTALLLSAGLLVSTGPAAAAPALTLDRSAVVMGMDVVGATETRPRPATPNSIAGAESIRWRNLGKVARHRSSPAGEPGSRPWRVAGFLASPIHLGRG